MDEAFRVFLLVVIVGFAHHLFNVVARKVNWHWWYRNIYLKSFHWKITRWMKKAQMWLFKGSVYCEKCRRKDRLTIHHITYKRLGHERMSDLQVICFYCHRPGSGRI